MFKLRPSLPLILSQTSFVQLNGTILACCVWFCLLHAALTTDAAVSWVQNRFLLMNHWRLGRESAPCGAGTPNRTAKPNLYENMKKL